VKPYSLERKPKPRSIGGDLFITPTKRMVGLATASQIALRITAAILEHDRGWDRGKSG